MGRRELRGSRRDKRFQSKRKSARQAGSSAAIEEDQVSSKEPEHSSAPGSIVFLLFHFKEVGDYANDVGAKLFTEL